jgi:hypothetical protein
MNRMKAYERLEQDFTYYVLIVIAVILSLVLCAQWYSRVSWERFKALHGCESIIYLNESSWEPVETAWTCDDGKTYFR